MEKYRKEWEEDLKREQARKENPQLAAYRRRMNYRPNQNNYDGQFDQNEPRAAD